MNSLTATDRGTCLLYTAVLEAREFDLTSANQWDGLGHEAQAFAIAAAKMAASAITVSELVKNNCKMSTRIMHSACCAELMNDLCIH